MVATIAAVTATLVSAAFVVRLARRARDGGPTSAAMWSWTAALAMFLVASAAMAIGTWSGWSPALFRVFYLFGAVLNVVWLAHGSSLANADRRVTSRIVGVVFFVAVVVLVRPAIDQPALYGPSVALGTLWGLAHLPNDRRVLARLESAVVVGFTLIAVPVVLSAGLVADVPVGALPEGRELFSAAVRGLAVAGNSFGAVAVIVGAIASSGEQVWRWPDRGAGETLRASLGRHARRGLFGWVDVVAEWVFAGRRGVDLAGRVRGNLLIALGVVVAALGGALSFLGDTTGHAVGLMVGVAIMFAGFRGAVAPTATLAVAAARAGRPKPVEGADPSPRSGHAVEVIVYTRQDCGLCAKAEALAAREGTRLRLVDVDGDPDLQRRFNVRVPVVVVDGQVVAEGLVSPGQIAAAVAAAASS